MERTCFTSIQIGYFLFHENHQFSIAIKPLLPTKVFGKHCFIAIEQSFRAHVKVRMKSDRNLILEADEPDERGVSSAAAREPPTTRVRGQDESSYSQLEFTETFTLYETSCRMHERPFCAKLLAVSERHIFHEIMF